MNVIGPGAISDVDLVAVKADISAIVTDNDIAESVIFDSPAGSTMDPASGLVTTTGEQSTATAYVSTLTISDIDPDSPYQVGDTRVIVMVADLSAAPLPETRFTAGGVVHRVIGTETDPTGTFYEVVGRRNS